jgi:hypothetical protein
MRIQYKMLPFLLITVLFYRSLCLGAYYFGAGGACCVVQLGHFFFVEGFAPLVFYEEVTF